jgi:hypothetical protein
MMNNKGNIFEELNKMKSLIHTKAGTVISEQFDNVKLMPTAYQYNQEREAAKNLSAVAATPRQKSINANYCSVKNGKIENPNLALNGQEFKNFVSANKVTQAEIAEAKKTCPNVVVPKTATGPTSTQRFITAATSLGIQNPKMDVATLQTILNTLNPPNQGVTESKNSVNEELNKMKYMLGYQRGRVISEQPAPAPAPAPAAAPAASPAPAPSTPKDLIRLIQTVLQDKFKQPLGPTGADGKWGKFTQDGLDRALKSVADLKQKREIETQQTNTQDAAPAATTGTAAPAAATTPAATTTPAAATTPAAVAPATAESPSDLYTRLVKGNLLVGRLNGKRAVYKGPDLSQEDSQKLQSYLSQQGYRLSRENNDYSAGDKLVFKKD